MATIEIESIKAITGAGSLRGFAVVTIAGKIRISDVRIIQQPNQRPWVAMPSRAFEQNGERKWSPIVELIDDDLKSEIANAVLAEYSKVAPAETVAAKPIPAGW
jgi:DNA-binding cell septation regulator SpoVG